MASKNLMGKTRPQENPYETWQAGGWTWKVLKKYQADDHKKFARWFVAVQSPYTFGGWELGDEYAGGIMHKATKVQG